MSGIEFGEDTMDLQTSELPPEAVQAGLTQEQYDQLKAQAEQEAGSAAQGADAGAAAPAAAAAPAQAEAAQVDVNMVDPAVLAQAQAQAEADAKAQALAEAQGAAAPAAAPAEAPAAAGTSIEAQARAQAEAQMQAEAEAQAQQQAAAEAAAPAPKPAARQTIQLDAASANNVNQAAAVAAAAEALMPTEKPWAKMSAAEKQAKLGKIAAEKKAKLEKEKLENPTVDANGEHIQTVAEAKAEAAQLQQMLVAGEAAVDQKIQMEQEQMAREPATPAEPVKQEEDDGHLETVEEVKAKMAAAQAAMDQGLAETDNRVAKMSQEAADMPNFGALADVHSTLSNMGTMRKKKQLADMAAKLGVEVQAGDEQLPAADLTQTLIARAQAAGTSMDQINAALAE